MVNFNDICFGLPTSWLSLYAWFYRIEGTCVIYELTMTFGQLGSNPLSEIGAAELLLETYCELLVCN